MISDEIGQKLHDRATRGEALTTEEHKLLRTWYAQQDEQELAQLNVGQIPNRLADLQSRVQQVSAQVVAQAKRIEALTK